MSEDNKKNQSTKTNSNNKNTKKSTTTKNGQKPKTVAAKKPAASKANGTKKTTTNKTTSAKKPAAKKPSTTGANANKKPVASKSNTTTKKATQNKSGTTKKQAAKKSATATTNATKKTVAKKPVAKKQAPVQQPKVDSVKVEDKSVTEKIDSHKANKSMMHTQFMSNFKGVKTEKNAKDNKITPVKGKPTKKQKIKKAKKVKKVKVKKKSIFTALNLFIATIALTVIVGVSFIAYVFIASSNDGPVYGERCASAIALDSEIISEVEKATLENEKVSHANIDVECLTVKITLTFIDDTTSADGESIALETLKALDEALGKDEFEGSIYSEAFNLHKDENQYDVEFILKSTGDTDFPIFGQKHPSSDKVSFTGSNPANADTTNSLIEEETEEDTEE